MASAASTAIVKTIANAVKEAAARPTNSLEPRDIPSVAGTITEALEPVILNATNNEPWYQSRVTWGAIGAIALPALAAVGIGTDTIDADEFVALGLAFGTIASGVLTLYGRWKARRPIGS